MGISETRSQKNEDYWKVRLMSQDRVAKLNENRKANELEGTEYNDDEIENLKGDGPGAVPWYIIEPYNFIPQIWEFIINTLTIYSFVSVPLV